MLLAGDIGGTKTLLGIFAAAPDRPSPVEVGEFVTLEYDALEPMVREFLRDLLVFIDVAPTGSAEAKHALNLPMPDFEDGMQAAAAVLAGADYIITRNGPDFRHSPIPAITPTDFLALPP